MEGADVGGSWEQMRIWREKFDEQYLTSEVLKDMEKNNFRRACCRLNHALHAGVNFEKGKMFLRIVLLKLTA